MEFMKGTNWSNLSYQEVKNQLAVLRSNQEKQDPQQKKEVSEQEQY